MNKLPRGTPLGFKLRTAIHDTAEAFWGPGWRLHDLKVRNADLHTRLRNGIAAVDKAFARGDEASMVRAARELVLLWREVTQAMPAAEAPKQRTWT